MKADLSRNTFHPEKHYRDVIRQQGRVDVDANWNEQQAINVHRVETEATDVIGQSGAPIHDAGFHIVTSVSDLTTEEQALSGNSVTPPALASGDFFISAGRYYVDGILCENEQLVSFSTQPDMPGQPSNPLQSPGTYIIYLDVWMRHITALDDDLIREKALGGPDTATRSKVVWQVKALNWTQPSAPAAPTGLHIANPLGDIAPSLSTTSIATAAVAPLTRAAVRPLATSITPAVAGAPVAPIAATTVGPINSQVAAVTPGISTVAPGVTAQPANVPPSATGASVGIAPGVAGVAPVVAGTTPGISTVAPGVTTQPASVPPSTTGVAVGVASGVVGVAPGVTGVVPGVVGVAPAGVITLVPPPSTSVGGAVAVPGQPFPVATPVSVSPCDAAFAQLLSALNPAAPGTLNARTQAPAPDQSLCQLPPSAGYQNLENQLYRVEIHRGNQGSNSATFKWSRDNGSVVTSIQSVSGNSVTVQDVGPDDALGFVGGQWVEIVDDSNDLSGTPGNLFQIDSVDKPSRTISLKTTPPTIDPALHPKLRRWDQTDTGNLSDGVAIIGDWQALEDGIQVQFSSNGIFRTGDYWLIPARTATGEIEWPPYAIPNVDPEPQPPLGIKHHYSCLGLLQVDANGGVSVTNDCRKLFPPLTEINGRESGIHITGVTVGVGESILANDGNVNLNDFARGIAVVCDGPLDATTVTRATCSIVVEAPLSPPNSDLVGFIGSQPVVLAATINVTGNLNVISWIPSGPVVPYLTFLLNQLVELKVSDIRLLLRMKIRGNFVRSADDPKLYLDGEAFGLAGGQNQSNLDLPSGDGRKGGDFEMWWWLFKPVNLTGIQLNPSTFGVSGGVGTATISLDGPAPVGGLIINVSSDNVKIATVDSSTVTVNPGATQAQFQFHVPQSIVNGVTCNIIAELSGTKVSAQLIIVVIG